MLFNSDELSRSESSSADQEFLAYDDKVNDSNSADNHTEVPLGPVKRSSRDASGGGRSPPSPSYSSSASRSDSSSVQHGAPSPFTMDSLCESKHFDSKRDLFADVSPKKGVTWSTASSIEDDATSSSSVNVSACFSVLDLVKTMYLFAGACLNTIT